MASQNRTNLGKERIQIREESDYPHPQIDIIMITYNSEDTVAKCLNSVLQQTYPHDKLRVIIVDNSSKDNTINIIEKISLGYIPKKVISLKHNIGFAKAVKIALRFSNTKYVFLLNPDATPPPNYLALLVKVLAQQPTLGIIEGLIVKDSIVISDGAFFDPLTGFDWSPCWKSHLSVYKGKFIEIRDYAPLTAALVRRDLLELLDEHFFLYNEDLDLALCARQRGYYCAVILKAYAEHKIELRKRKLSELRVYNHVKGRLYLLWKNLPYPFLLTSFFLWSIILPLTLFFINRKLARASILAIAHFFKEEKARKSQRKCKVTLPIRTLAALKNIVKHMAYGGHIW